MSNRQQTSLGITEIEQEEQSPLSLPGSSTTMRDTLFERFKDRIIHNSDLDRTLVSFQANKSIPFYGWFKYREGFSQPLVTYLLQKLMAEPGILLDPFAGGGAALFAAAEIGWESRGIEVLPVGVYAMNARLVAERINLESFISAVDQVQAIRFSDYYNEKYAFAHIAITNGAYPEEEERQLVGYLAYCNQYIEDKDVCSLLLYAAFCILEDISYTRKDGQYLRWDARSGRSLGKSRFNKGPIYSFKSVIANKLCQIVNDLRGHSGQISLFGDTSHKLALAELDIHAGSCLELLPTMANASIDFVLTSPPYVNRYDYTRTYALELVFLGCNDEEVKQLRQTMLSCTVENKDKREQIKDYYSKLNRISDFYQVDHVFHNQEALHEVLTILDTYRDNNQLNNPQIARLVRNYFYEMCFVIYELARILRPGGIVAMVNDNVRYAGEEIPVDLILSNIAESFGLTTRNIWTLGRGKGNSSQQMGNHGRTELRKCVYVWQRDK